MDRYAAPIYLHEEAIYIHGGQQHQVEKLDWEEKKAYVRQVYVDYYTDAELAVAPQVTDVFAEDVGEPPPSRARGTVRAQLALRTARSASPTSRRSSRRSSSTPTRTSAGARSTCPRRSFRPPPSGSRCRARTAGLPEDEIEGGLVGLANLLGAVAPLYLMCDPHDVGVVPPGQVAVHRAADDLHLRARPRRRRLRRAAVHDAPRPAPRRRRACRSAAPARAAARAASARPGSSGQHGKANAIRLGGG